MCGVLYCYSVMTCVVPIAPYICVCVVPVNCFLFFDQVCDYVFNVFEVQWRARVRKVMNLRGP